MYLYAATRVGGEKLISYWSFSCANGVVYAFALRSAVKLSDTWWPLSLLRCADK